MSNKFYHIDEKNKLVLNNYDNILDCPHISIHIFKQLRNIFGDDFLLLNTQQDYVSNYSYMTVINEDAAIGKRSLQSKPKINIDCYHNIAKITNREYGYIQFIQFSTQEQMILFKMLNLTNI